MPAIKMITIDLDGTLLRSDGSVSDRTVRTLQAARDKGVVVAIATGRMYQTARPYVERLGLGDSPLLLVRERRLSSIEVIVNGDVQNGLTLVSSEGPVGAVIPVWLYGSELVDTSSWRGGLPADVLERVRFWYPRALMVPVQAEERFRLDASSGRVEIRDRFEYAETADEWGTERRPCRRWRTTRMTSSARVFRPTAGAPSGQAPLARRRGSVCLRGRLGLWTAVW